MDSIFDTISTICRTQCRRCVDLGLNGVLRTAHVIPLLDCTIGNDFHSNANIALQVLPVRACFWAQKSASCSWGKSAHFHLWNDETVLVDRVYNFTSVHVSIRFDHSELCFFASCKLLASEGITIVSNLELSCIDCDDRSDVKLCLTNAWLSDSFEELARVFQIILHKKPRSILS